MYTKTTWTNDVTALSETNMNNIETGVEGAAKGTIFYADSSAGSDSYAITFSPALTSYATGLRVSFKADVANTGACTLNINSLGAKTIKKNVSDDLADNDIKANQVVTVVYDGTNFQIIGASSSDGCWVKISETTTSEAAAYIDITIPDGYKKFKLFGDFIKTSGASNRTPCIRFNADAGSNYYVALSQDTTHGQTAGYADPYIKLGYTDTINNTKYCNFELTVDNAVSIPKIFGGYFSFSGSEGGGIMNGNWNNTASRITSIRILLSADNIASGARFTL